MSITDPANPGRGNRSVAFRIACAAFLVGCTLSAFIPATAALLAEETGAWGIGIGIVPYAVGLWIPGALNAFLVENFYRKRLFFCSAALAAACGAAIGTTDSVAVVVLLRLLQGIGAGIIWLSLATLVNDLTLSAHRTWADSLLSWFRRCSLPVGVALGHWLSSTMPLLMACLLSLIPIALACLSLVSLNVPFKAPICQRRFSTDRFWLSRAFPLTLTMWPVAAVCGMLIAEMLPPVGYVCLAAGCVVAKWCEHVALAHADERAQIVAGLLLMAAGILLYSYADGIPYHLPLFVCGIGIGLVSSRFLLYYLKLSGHCQRGTAQHTHMLTWETGLALGCVAICARVHFGFAALLLTALSLVLYLGVTHAWFVKHRDRDFKFREI